MLKNKILLLSDVILQVFGIRAKPVKYHCCDCRIKLKARSQTVKWRNIPADQKRCRRCSAKRRGLLKGKAHIKV
jgi:hypothetical protein